MSDCYHRCSHRCQEVVAVAALNIRNLNETVKRRLQVRAARHGRSMEAEVRAILEEAVASPRTPPGCSRRSSTGSARSAESTWTCPDATNRRAPQISPHDHPRHQRGLRADAPRTRASGRELGPRPGQARATHHDHHARRGPVRHCRLPEDAGSRSCSRSRRYLHGLRDQVLPVDTGAAENYAVIASSRERAETHHQLRRADRSRLPLPGRRAGDSQRVRL